MNYALVTGGSRGIGRAICLALSKMGYPILLNYLANDAAAAATAEAIREQGGTVELLKFDVSDPGAVDAALGAWREAHPDAWIEVLVNNAGIRRDQLLIWMEPEDWNRVLRTNLDALYYVTRAVLQPMLLKKKGRIINIASLSGQSGLPGQINYAAAKGGVIAATKALAQEIGKKKVTVNAVAPGFIRTDMIEDLDEDSLKKTIPLQRFGTAEEVAAVVAFLASEGAAYITGECISVNGGLYC